jgi:RNA polymerase sigma-70 factor (ECF subfamily)
LEGDILSLRAAGDLRQAATRAIEGYGAEVLGFLFTLMRNEDDASDVFGQASEDLWAGLANFEGRASVRTWFYCLARHAASRFRRSPHRRPGRHVPLSEAGDAAARVRTRTPLHLRTEESDRIAGIRDALDPEDRALLVLRIDRGMSWKEIAEVLELLDEEDESRATARLRKRYQAIKEEIRTRAEDAGLLRPRDD